ncbi:hypothetical protein HZH68_003922 [Vespula germanica]|uniref:Uncharacterized protein n=1 Tax=Vespula germanica TaxID=30212 RepID=A0A834KPH7_VESGE|nr:hypothetical protein HZH68_003922 [Vespula germanica]
MGQIWTKKICAYREQRALSNGPGLVPLGAMVSEKKIVKEKFIFPLFYINRYISAPIGQIWTEKIWAYRAQGELSNGSRPVPLGAIARSGREKYGRIGREETLPTAPGPLLSGRKKYGRRMSTKKIWACSAQRALFSGPGPVPLGAIVSEKKIVKKKFFFPMGYINRYISAPIGQIWTEKIWTYRAQRDLSKGFRTVTLSAIVSEKKIVKVKFFFPLFYINRYISAPIGHIWTKKIWAYRVQRDLSNGTTAVPQGAIVSEKKIVKEKFFYPLFYINRYISGPISQIWTKKIRAFREQRDLSNGPTAVPQGAIVSEKKIVKEKFFFPLFYINHYISPPVGHIWTKKIWAYRAQRVLSNGPGPVPLGQIWPKKIWAYRGQRGLSNGPGPVPLGAIVSDKKIVKVRSGRQKIQAQMEQGGLSNGAGPVPLGAIVSEKKIDKVKFFFPLFYINRYISAPMGQIWTKKIWAYREQRAVSNGPGRVPLSAMVSEKKIVKEKFISPFTHCSGPCAIGNASLRPKPPYFLCPDVTNRSRDIAVYIEQWKKNFPLTIFFSETIASRGTGPGPLERTLCALYAHIFRVHMWPIGAHLDERARSHWKGLFAPYTPIFLSSRSGQ